MQVIHIIGFIGRDAEIKDSNGNKFVVFPVATNRVFKNQQGQKVEQTTWYNVLINNEKTGLLPYLTKGTQVAIVGDLSTSIYRSNNDGQYYTDLKVTAFKTELLSGGKKDNQNSSQQGTAQNQSTPQNNPAPMPYDDLPF